MHKLKPKDFLVVPFMSKLGSNELEQLALEIMYMLYYNENKWRVPSFRKFIEFKKRDSILTTKMINQIYKKKFKLAYKHVYNINMFML